MIGRGSRVIPGKSEFTVIDLGNNAHRFGMWESAVDWQDIFAHPDAYIDNIVTDELLERNLKYEMPPELKARFANSVNLFFDVKENYTDVLKKGGKVKEVIDRSVAQHLQMIRENSTDVWNALELTNLLQEDVRSRVKHYSYCIARSTESYLAWMRDEYMRKLQGEVRKAFA